MISILITAIGGDIAQGVATILRDSGRAYRLVGTDIHEEHGGSLFVDAWHRVPPANDAGYQSELLALIEAESIDVVIPISEPELQVWSGSDKRFGRAQWLMLDDGIVDTCLDKLATMEFLQGLGLPVPWTSVVGEGKPQSLPCILKDRFGSGSKNLHLVSDQTDIEYLSSRYPEAIFQDLLLPAENELTCAIYRSQDRRSGLLQMRRRLTGGLSSWIETVDDQRVADLCNRIADGFNLVGSLNIQLRITAEGPLVFEINPRFSSTALMRHKLGFCDVLWSLDELAGEKIEFPAPLSGHAVARTHAAAIIDQKGSTK